MLDRILALSRSNPFLAIILAGFFVIAITYSVVTPIFEAGDEIWHYPYVQHLATGNSLPIQDPGVKTLWAQEGGQPPLYYSIAALATFWIDTHDLPERLWYNPHAKIGIPLLFGNKNMVVHTSAENFPWHNTALAVHLIRLLSILFSAATVALTYFLTLEIQDDKALAAVAAAIVAFNPMFIFISASVNNDSLAVMLAALALLLSMRLLTRGAATRRYIALGVVLGLAAITKVSDLGLIVIAGIVFLWSLGGAERRNIPLAAGRQGLVHRVISSSHLLVGPALSAALVIAIAGWWYLRNYLLYGDPFAFNIWIAIAGGRPVPATLATLLGEFQGLRISFWGNFGGVNIIAPEWVYMVLDLLTACALIGLFIGLARRVMARMLAMPAFWLIVIFVALARWTMLTLASQGRLLFPAISAIAILLAFGLDQVRYSKSTPQIRILNYEFGILNLMFVIFLFAFSALAPFTLIAPTYAQPKRLAADATVPHPTRIVFEDQAELVGYDLPQRSVQPGVEMPITLFWRGIKPMTEDFSVYIHLFDSAGNRVGQWDAYPGNGAYPTRLWRNETIVDSYRVPVAGDAKGPSVGRIEVGLYRKDTLINLTARDPQGRAITPRIARFKIDGALAVEAENPVRFEFDNRIALVGSSIPLETRPGGSLQVRLYWRALAPIDEDYAVFVHVVDAQGKMLAQKDDQPQNSAYPTSFWDVGETVPDDHVIEIPRDAQPGGYRIQVGLYRPTDNTRLRVDSSDHLDLTTVRIVR